MKSTKTLLFAALAAGGLLAGSTALRADDSTNATPVAPPAGHRHPMGMREHARFDRMAQALNLTDEQKPKVQAVMEGQMKKMREIWQNSDLSREDRMAKMKAIRESADKKLKNILTADQFKKFQEIRSEMRHRPHGPPPAGSNKPDDVPASPPAASPQD